MAWFLRARLGDRRSRRSLVGGRTAIDWAVRLLTSRTASATTTVVVGVPEVRGELTRVPDQTSHAPNARFTTGETSIVVGLACASPIFGEPSAWDLVFSGLFASVVFVSNLRPFLGLIPIPVASLLWERGLVDDISVVPVLLFVVVHMVSFRFGVVLSASIVAEWLLFAYVPLLGRLLFTEWAATLLVEGLLLGIVIWTGRARNRLTWSRHELVDAQRRARAAVVVELRESLHDSLARKITMMTMLSDRVLARPDGDSTVREISEMSSLGRDALTELENLMREVSDDPDLTEQDDSVWVPDSLDISVVKAMRRLVELGFDVKCRGQFSGLSIPAKSERALVLSLQECIANSAKYAPEQGKIDIERVDKPGEVGVAIRNQTPDSQTSISCSFSTKTGLVGVFRRIGEVQGTVHLSSSFNSWQILMLVPLERNIEND